MLSSVRLSVRATVPHGGKVPHCQPSQLPLSDIELLIYLIPILLILLSLVVFFLDKNGYLKDKDPYIEVYVKSEEVTESSTSVYTKVYEIILKNLFISSTK